MQIYPRNRRFAAWPLLFPVLLAGIVFSQVGGFTFVNLDDDIYVTGNPLLENGLDVGAAFGSRHAEVWIPLTWVSFMIDQELSGLEPAGFHRTNLTLHLLNVLLAGLLLRRFLDPPWVVVTAAALFAVHPLQVEAVTWVTARKDLLAGLFTLAALAVHTGRRGVVWGLATVLLGCCAMLAKPAAVVLPAWLVLVDLWQAARTGRDWRAALKRQAPVKLATAGMAIAVALVAVRLARGTEFGYGIQTGLVERVGQAGWMIVVWLGKVLVPHSLAPIYPPTAWEKPAALLVVAVLSVILLTALAIRAGRQRPALLAGWLWFLIGIAPAVGIVRGGQLLLSDRYLYLPLLGLAVIVADLAGALAGRRPRWRLPVKILAAAAVLALAGAAWNQARVWRDPAALWAHTLAVTDDNAVAHISYAVVLEADGRSEEALRHLNTSIRISPHNLAHYNAGNILRRLGRREEAIAHFRATLRDDPDRYEAALNLSGTLAEVGRPAEALPVLEDALQWHPEVASLHYNLGLVQWMLGEEEAAVAAWRAALERDPDHAGAKEMLAGAAATSRPANPDSSGP